MNTSVVWQISYSVVGHPQKIEVQKEPQPYWSHRNEIAIVDGTAITGRRIIISASMQDKAIIQEHINHMGIEKIRRLACESLYWTNKITNTEEAIKSFPTCLDYQAELPKDIVLSHRMPGRPWEAVLVDIHTINNKHYLCIVDCYRKFLVMTQVEGFSTDNLIKP